VDYDCANPDKVLMILFRIGVVIVVLILFEVGIVELAVTLEDRPHEPAFAKTLPTRGDRIKSPIRVC
jgi:hypothetical protein